MMLMNSERAHRFNHAVRCGALPDVSAAAVCADRMPTAAYRADRALLAVCVSVHLKRCDLKSSGLLFSPLIHLILS